MVGEVVSITPRPQFLPHLLHLSLDDLGLHLTVLISEISLAQSSQKQLKPPAAVLSHYVGVVFLEEPSLPVASARLYKASRHRCGGRPLHSHI